MRVLIIISLLLAAYGAVLFFLKCARYRRWRHTNGTVVDLIRHESSDGDSVNVSFSPRVSFRTSDGQTIEFVSRVSSFPAPALGARLPLLYDPTDPHETVINRFVFRHWPETLVIGVGVAGILIYVFAA